MSKELGVAVVATPTNFCSKKPVKSTPSSDKKFKSDEFIESSNEEEEGEMGGMFYQLPPLSSCVFQVEEGEGTSSSHRRSQRNDNVELIELSEGSHDESEAEMSGSDEDDDDDD